GRPGAAVEHGHLAEVRARPDRVDLGPPTDTAAVPFVRTKKPFPVSPSFTNSPPRSYPTPEVERSTLISSCRERPENSGTACSVSRCSDRIHRRPSAHATITTTKMTPGTTQALTEPAPIHGSIAVPPNLEGH